MKLFKRILIYTFIFLLLFSIIYFSMQWKIQKEEKNNIFKQNINKEENLIVNEVSSKLVYFNDTIGYLTIEKIGMYNEEIKEGVDAKTLSSNIGHFSNTSLLNGNVCLAAHNYSINTSSLFSNLNKLNIGDSIIYKTSNGEHEYIVYKIYEIKDNDFSILENTNNENVITLITCIGDRKDLRLCVKAREI